MRSLAILVWAALCALTGYTLFHIAFQVESLEARLNALDREILREQEAMRVLDAEWSYLSRPARIADLAELYLPSLADSSVAQIATIDEVPYPAVPPERPAHPPIPGAGTGAGAILSNLETTVVGEVRR